MSGRPKGSKNKKGHGAGRPSLASKLSAFYKNKNDTNSNVSEEPIPTESATRPLHPFFTTKTTTSLNSLDTSTHPDQDQNTNNDSNVASVSVPMSTDNSAEVAHGTFPNLFEITDSESESVHQLPVSNTDTILIDLIRESETEMNRSERSADADPDIEETDVIMGEDEVAPVEILSSSLAAYLQSLRLKLDKEMANDPRHIPECLKKGNGWVLQEDPYFILQKQTHPDPFSIILPDVYVNIPHLKADLRCSCGSLLSSHGWSLRYRKVICLDRVWYLLSKRYRCDSRGKRIGCGRTYVGHSPFILQQLPQSVQLDFPAFLTQRLGISKKLFDLLRPCFHNRLGPGPLHHILRELHTKRYDFLHLSYIEAAKFRYSNPSAISQHSHLVNNQQFSFQAFPDFFAADGYGGHIPSPGYLSGIYNIIQRKYQPDRDQHMSMLEATILSSDFSHKLPSRVAKVEGHPMFTAVHTMMNNYGEVRLHTLVASKSLLPLTTSIKGMLNSLLIYGHPQPQLLFVDDVKGESSFFTRCIPSLMQDVQQITLDEYRHLEDYQLPPNVHVIIAKTSNECSQLIEAYIIDYLNSSSEESIVIGFDCEWAYDEFVGPGKVAICQIAFKEVVLVIQLHQIGFIPEELKLIITNERIVKVGRNVGGDIKKLRRDYPFVQEHKSILELGKLCRQQGIVNNGTAGLSKLCAAALKKRLPKPDTIRVGMDWENLSLTSEQIHYAAKDAYVALEIYHAAISSDIVGIIPTQPRLNQPVQILSKDANIVVAIGTIASWAEEKLDNIKITKTRQVVRVDQINAPGAIMPLYSNKTYGQLTPPELIVTPLISLRTCRPLSVTPIPSENSPSSTQINSSSLPEDDLNAEETSIPDENSAEFDALVDTDELVFEDSVETINEGQECSIRDLAESSSLEENTVEDTLIDSESLNIGQDLLQDLTTISNTESRPSRVINDIWHVMDRIKIPKNHGIAKKYAKTLSQGIFIVDEADKSAVSKVLSDKGTTWEKMLISNPKWLWRRCKRHVPPPNKLLPVVRDIFLTFGPILCSKTKKPLFNAEAWKKAKLILEDIYMGLVSDPAGYSMYYEDNVDGDKLPLYRCIRGTNGLEGGIHQKMIARFGPYNASVLFSVGLMGEYVLRHNLDVGTLNRTGRKYRWHYDIWTINHIHSLYVSLQKQIEIPKRMKSWINGSFYEQTAEKFLITPMSEAQAIDLGISAYESKSRSEKLECKHDNVAELQNTKFAVVPVHNSEEIRLFKELVKNVLPIPNSGRLSVWRDLVLQWNLKADGKTIFYKSVEYLDSYSRKWSKHLVEEKTALQYAERWKTLCRKLKERSHKETPKALEREASLTQVPPTHGVDIIDIDTEDTFTIDTIQDPQNQTGTQENEIDGEELESSLQASAITSSSANSSTETSSNVTIKRKQRLCAVCGGVCPGRGNKKLCKGIGPSSIVLDDGTQVAQRKERTCGVCGLSSCPGRGNRKLCKSTEN